MPPDYTPFERLVPVEHRARLVAAVRVARDELGLSNAVLGFEIEELIKAHNGVAGRVPIKLTSTGSDVGPRTNEQLNTLARAPKYIPGYLAWLCWRAPERAKAFCHEARIDYLPYERAGIADEAAGPKDTAWDALIRRYGRFERLEVLSYGDAPLGLITLDDGEPVANRTLRLHEGFGFRFDAPGAGCLFAFQRYRQRWYPLPLTKGPHRYRIEAGAQILPRKADGSPAPLRETANPDLYGFAFLVAEKPELAAFCDRFEAARSLPEELAASARELLDRLPHASRRIYRINVRIEP